jgi:bifunctional non-homologous end joining protein LigD
MNIYKPILAKAACKPFSSNKWIFEVKWDGFRALAYVGSRFSLKSRKDYEFKYEFPEIVELRHLTKNVVLDGELIIMRKGRRCKTRL